MPRTDRAAVQMPARTATDHVRGSESTSQAGRARRPECRVTPSSRLLASTPLLWQGGKMTTRSDHRHVGVDDVGCMAGAVTHLDVADELPVRALEAVGAALDDGAKGALPPRRRRRGRRHPPGGLVLGGGRRRAQAAAVAAAVVDTADRGPRRRLPPGVCGRRLRLTSRTLRLDARPSQPAIA